MPAINQTLSRTIITQRRDAGSGGRNAWCMGGETVLRGFATGRCLVGIVVGTYSSIYVSRCARRSIMKTLGSATCCPPSKESPGRRPPARDADASLIGR